jgi:hypothetical protein
MLRVRMDGRRRLDDCLKRDSFGRQKECTLAPATVAQHLRMAPLLCKTDVVEQDNMSCAIASCSLSGFSKDGCNIGGHMYVLKGYSGVQLCAP